MADAFHIMDMHVLRSSREAALHDDAAYLDILRMRDAHTAAMVAWLEHPMPQDADIVDFLANEAAADNRSSCDVHGLSAGHVQFIPFLLFRQHVETRAEIDHIRIGGTRAGLFDRVGEELEIAENIAVDFDGEIARPVERESDHPALRGGLDAIREWPDARRCNRTLRRDLDLHATGEVE